MSVRAGMVYLVGAGPGDAGLITVRGAELLRRADVVLYDRLVAPALLAMIPAGARCVSVGKARRGDSGAQGRINARLVRLAQRGRVVVRLKGGDPLVFGRGWEEAQACRAAGVPVEIVPGVSSAFAAPLRADIPVTARGVASSVAVAAAPALTTRAARALASADTAVLLMAVGDLARTEATLMAAGIAPGTPGAIVASATWPGEAVVRAPLGELAAAAEHARIASPAVVVFGKAAALAVSPSGALAGRRIVVTRPFPAAYELISALRAHGADVIAEPLIDVRCVSPKRFNPATLAAYDWVVFTSRHGVEGFRHALERCADTRALHGARLAAVGPGTARELAAWGLRADLVPRVARADALAEALVATRPRPARVLFAAGTRALEELPRALRAAGVRVDIMRVYTTRLIRPPARLRTALRGGVDAILLASPSAADALGAPTQYRCRAPVICIGPTTATAARRNRWRRVHVAGDHSDAGMVAATLDHLGTRAQ